jgi:hypothetical protein
MGKIRVGNKQNSILNGEWAKHVRKEKGKRTTSKLRRAESRNILLRQTRNS